MRTLPFSSNTKSTDHTAWDMFQASVWSTIETGFVLPFHVCVPIDFILTSILKYRVDFIIFSWVNTRQMQCQSDRWKRSIMCSTWKLSRFIWLMRLFVHKHVQAKTGSVLFSFCSLEETPHTSNIRTFQFQKHCLLGSVLFLSFIFSRSFPNLADIKIHVYVQHNSQPNSKLCLLHFKVNSSCEVWGNEKNFFLWCVRVCVCVCEKYRNSDSAVRRKRRPKCP